MYVCENKCMNVYKPWEYMKFTHLFKINISACLLGALVVTNVVATNNAYANTACFKRTADATQGNAAITTSGNLGDAYRGFQAFDSSPSSMWISASGSSPAWIAYNFVTPVTIDKYSILYVNGSITTRAPKEWTLQGFDGSNWITVDNRNNETKWSGYQKRSYDIASPRAFTSYKLLVTDDNDSHAGVVAVSIGDLSFESCNVAFVEGSWQEDQLRKTTDTKYYVPLNIDLGVARYRQTFIFRANGVAEILRLAPNDAHYSVTGTWSLSGDILTLKYSDNKFPTTSGTFVDTFQVLEADVGHLALKKIN